MKTQFCLALCTICFFSLFFITCSPSTTTIPANTFPANTFPDYTIPIEKNRFMPNVHISITDDTSTEVSGLSYYVNGNNRISVNGLVNIIGVDKKYTLTISPVQGFFTTTDGNISINITEPNSENNFSPGNGTLSKNTFTVTNEGDESATEYTLVVPFNGTAVNEWLTQPEFSTYFTGATFASQFGSLSFDGSSITINGGNINIVPDGDIVLSMNLPTGYSATGHDVLKVPAGIDENTTGEVGSFTIREVGNRINRNTYPVRINLAAYSSPVRASHISVTFNGNDANPSSDIEIRESDIIIKGFPNIAGSTGAGLLSITPPTTGEFTIDSDSYSLSFTDPEGTASAEIVLDSINILSDDFNISHNIIVEYDSAIFSLIITNDNVENNPVTITKGDTITIAGMVACEILPLSTIEIVNAPVGSVVKNFPRYFDRRIDSLTADVPPVYQQSRSLIIEDANGNIVDSDFPITMKGFPDCNANALTRSGDSAANAHQIDSAQKLELLSHLVRTDNRNYGSKYYKLTDDIDLGLTGLPWSETISGDSGEGFPPIGEFDLHVFINFQGEFDCAGHTISNLYINRKNNHNIALFGYAEGATIQNCSLVDVNVSGNSSVGGLAGTLNSGTHIRNSYVTGIVSGNKYNIGGNVGGLVGFQDSNSHITNSYATASVSGNRNIGGLVGVVSVSSSITNSYATGTVTGSNQVGGLVGLQQVANITNSYATGLVSGTTAAGGLIGAQKSSRVTNSYWDITTSRQADSAGGTGRATTELQILTPEATGWGTNVWEFDPADQYPRLKTVACANRQYELDQSIACGSL